MQLVQPNERKMVNVSPVGSKNMKPLREYSSLIIQVNFLQLFARNMLVVISFDQKLLLCCNGIVYNQQTLRINMKKSEVRGKGHTRE